MKRRTSTTPCRVWTFGCRPATRGAELAAEQLRLAHRYYNKLIEIERSRRSEYRGARSGIDSALAALEAERDQLSAAIEAARTEIKAARQKKRAHVEASGADKASVARLRAKRKEVTAQLRIERQRVATDPALLAESERINKRANQRIAAAREGSGVYWGSYLLIEKAVEQARKSAASDPEFKRYRGEGRIGVQLQGMHTIEEVLAGTNTFLQIDPLPTEQWQTRSGRRHARTLVRLRVGSNADRSPIWVEFPVIVHRKIPAGARVTWAWIGVRKVGPNERFELQLTLESPAFARIPTGKGAVAIDIGWRVVPKGIRVGYAIDDAGHERELVLPDIVRQRLEYCSYLQSVMDSHFNAARAALGTYLGNDGAIPEWMTEQIRYLGQWRAPHKLGRVVERWRNEVMPEERVAVLWNRWKTERLARKADLFGPRPEIDEWLVEAHPGLGSVERMVLYLEWWRRKYDHLYRWIANQRENVLAARRDLYRNWAHQMQKHYETIVIEDFDLRAFTRNAPPEADKDQTHHRLRNTASPSELVQCLISAAGKECVVKLDPADTTRQCFWCSHVNTEWEKPEERVQTCAGCKRQWDQDHNAARMLLKRFNEGDGNAAPEPEPTPEPPKKKRVATIIETSSAL